MVKIAGHVERKEQMAPQLLRADFVPNSLNKDDRTIDVVFATENPIRMWNWDNGFFNETLSVKESAMRLERVAAGVVPVLDNHDRSQGTKGVLGRVMKVWVSGAKAYATLRFSKRADPYIDGVWKDIEDGILKGISVGYRVYEYEIEERQDEIPDYLATDWETTEISVAPIPADYKSSVRSADDNKSSLNEVTIRSKNNPAMEETPEQKAERMRKEGIAAERKRQNEIRAAVRAANFDDTYAQTLIDADHSIEKVRDLIAARQSATPAPGLDAEKLRKEGVDAERKRSGEIKTAVRNAKLTDEYAQELIDGNHTIEKAREMILAKFAEADPGAGATGAQRAAVSADEADKRREALAEALAYRAAQDLFTGKRLEDVNKNEFRGYSLQRMAYISLEAQGAKLRGLSDSDIARIAMNQHHERAGLMTVSDLPIVMGNTINRTLRASYEIAERTFPAWTRKASAKDFRDITRVQLSEFSDISQVNEGSEYEYGTFSDGAEKYRVFKYGKIIAVTWESIINDDLDSFGRIPQAMANSVARKQSDLVYGILTTNAALADGVVLFHANHFNLGTPAAISINSLGEGRKLIRKQKGPAGKDFLNLTPSFLIVGPDKEQEALQFMSSAYNPTQPDQINVWKGTLKPVVEPRLTGNQWYMAVAPSQIDTIEYSFLEGQPEIFTETRQGFNVDGLETKVRTVFGCKALDFRGLAKNAGN